MDPMEEVDETPVYDLHAEPLEFGPTTLYVKNIQSDLTSEEFFSIMSQNDRVVEKFKLFPPKDNGSTTIALITFVSECDAEHAFLRLQGKGPQKFILQYANDHIKDIKNFINPLWTDAVAESLRKQRRAYAKYRRRPNKRNWEAFRVIRNTGKRLRCRVKENYESKLAAEQVDYEIEDRKYEGVSETEAEGNQIRPNNVIVTFTNDISCSSSSNLENMSESASKSEELCQRTSEGSEEITFAFSSSPDLEKIRQKAAQFAEERNWDTYHQPHNLLLALVGEVGELSELFQWKGEVHSGLPGWSDKDKEHLGEELSDVLLYLIRLSEKCHVDLPSAVEKKLALNAKNFSLNRSESASKYEEELQGRSKERRVGNAFSFSSFPDLENIRQEVAKFAQESKWNIFHQPRNLLLALVGEVGELSELFRWKNEVHPGLPGWSKGEKEHLSKGLSDVLIYLVRLSDKCHVDLPTAVERKSTLNAKKYPAAKVYGSSKKYTEYENDELLDEDDYLYDL